MHASRPPPQGRRGLSTLHRLSPMTDQPRSFLRRRESPASIEAGGLIADLTASEGRGGSCGLRQSLDTVGAFLGPLLAMLFMLLTANQFTLVFWIAVVPAFLSVAVIIFGVSEPERPAGAEPLRNPL